MNEPPQVGIAPACDSSFRPIGDPADPASLASHERLSELTSILAKAVNRLRSRPRIAASGDPPESSQTGLEAVATTRPYGNGRQPERTPEA